MKETKFKQTEVGMIPSDWDVAVLGKITTHVDYRGKTPKKKPLGIQLITAKNIRMGYIDYKSNQEFVSEDDYLDVMKRGLPQKGDVLITTEAPCGYVAQIDNEKIALAQRVIKYRGNNGLINDYLSRYFQSELFQNILASLNTGGTVQGIKGSVLHTLPVVLPKSTEEQQHIANALSDVDTLINNLEKLIAKKKNIKQGAMQQLLTGKKRLPGFAPAKPTYKQTELGQIPTDWEMKKIGDFCKVYDGTHQTPHYVDVGIPFYSVENVSADDFEHTKFISNSEYEFISKRASIEKGDVLMTRIGSIGVCKYVDWDCKSGFYVSLSLLKCNEKIDARYLCQQSKSDIFKKEIELHSLTTAIPQKINLGPISQVRIIVPSSKREQTAIANVLSDMDAEISALETKLAKYRTLKTGMMQQLLTGKIRLV